MATAVQFDERFRDRQAKTRSLTPARTPAVDLTERRHRNFDFFRAHAEAAVANEDDNPVIIGAQCFDGDDAVRRCEFNGVGKYVREYLFELQSVAPHRGQIVRDRSLHLYAGFGRLTCETTLCW